MPRRRPDPPPRAAAATPGARDPLEGLAHAIRVVAGRSLTPEERRRFGRYLEVLLQWNRAQRLTAHRTRTDIVRWLFQDSLLFLPLLPPGPITVVDIGAGAGIPGIPLRIVEPRLCLTLVEARRRRVSFLRAVGRELALDDLRVLEGRAETLVQQPDLLGEFDVALARAAGPAEALVPVALGYLRPGGRFVSSGPPADGPLPPIPPGSGGQWKRVSFPALGLTRAFLVVEKKG